jgi:acetyltransferase-like isoleucine patch superfamily enzyme
MARSFLTRGTEALIGRLKRNPGYRIEYDYAGVDMLELLARRFVEMWRGTFVKMHLGHTRGIVFSGRHITIRHGRHIRAGTALIVGDGVLLDALGTGGIDLGDNVTIGRGAALVCTGVVARPGASIRIGNRAGIGDHSFLSGQGGIDIGKDVLLGPGVRVFSENHRFDMLDRPIRDQGEERAPVVVEDDCWIGAGATILGGVTIGRGTVVAAGAVVSRDTPERSVVMGVPARVTGHRDELTDPQETRSVGPVGN